MIYIMLSSAFIVQVSHILSLLSPTDIDCNITATPSKNKNTQQWKQKTPKNNEICHQLNAKTTGQKDFISIALFCSRFKEE